MLIKQKWIRGVLYFTSGMLIGLGEWNGGGFVVIFSGVAVLTPCLMQSKEVQS